MLKTALPIEPPIGCGFFAVSLIVAAFLLPAREQTRGVLAEAEPNHAPPTAQAIAPAADLR